MNELKNIVGSLRNALTIMNELSTTGRRNRMIATAVENTIDDAISKLEEISKQTDALNETDKSDTR